MKNRFLKILQNLQENTCTGDFIKKSYRSQGCTIIYWNNFFAYQRLILLDYFHQKISKQKMAVFKIIEAATGGVPLKRCSRKFHKICRKTPVSESLFWSTLLKIFCYQETMSLHITIIFFLPLISELSLYKVSITPRTMRPHRF